MTTSASSASPVAARPRVTIYTDGACKGNPGRGGWGAWLSSNGHEKELFGGERLTTNNRMELTAAVRALEALAEPARVTIVTDSEYLKKAFTDGWLARWQRNGWRTAGRQPVKNQDLWQRLLQLTSFHDVSWEWTRGHAGHEQNEIVDRLALSARRQGR